MKIKKGIKILLLIIVIFVVGYYLMFHVFSGVQTAFGKSCYKIALGMNKSDVISLMSDFQNKNKVSFKEGTTSLAYYTEGFSGDYQCYVTLDEKNRVKGITKIFD
jgi:hypothetical protein